MGEIKGYIKYKRQNVGHRPVEQRIRDYHELDLPLTPDEIRRQAARCMDCGIPFCHGAGCPLGNSIPDFNDLVYKGQWERACRMLHATNNFPEITGRICPAPCEASCTLSINDEPVTIRQIEQAIVERGFQQGWIKPVTAEKKTGKRVAIIGSGPAGLAAAQQLARAGHDVVVFERDEHAGGMLRYGIPDFKLEKQVLDRRIEQLTAEGVRFQTGLDVGTDISTHYLQKMFDCICLTMGARQPRDIAVPGREYGNIIFALDYLTTQNRFNNGEPPHLSVTASAGGCLTAKGKVVAVIGGGDTGSDCVGTARRQGAKKIYQLEILPKPPETRPIDTPWPMWPRIMRTSTSHEEGCERMWSVMTKKFVGSEKNVSELHGCKVEWIKPTLPAPSKVEGSKVEGKDSDWKIQEVPGTDFVLKVDLVLLAMGFLHVVHQGFIQTLGLQLDDRGNVLVTGYQTSKPRIFAAGDVVSGASLVVNAIKSGREAAAAIHRWLISPDSALQSVDS
jgi:glutamate synthase (NADPH/NADH) small chain